jgi:hypothetical protein
MKRSERTYTTCPYNSLERDKFFKTANTNRVSGLLPLTIEAATRVSSFGSCFAQKIASNMKARGIQYLDYEKRPPDVAGDPKDLGYEMFSARTGNIYTTPQWLQLIKRAVGVETVDPICQTGCGGDYIIVTRPFIGSFATREEAEREEANHLAAVARVIRDSEVMVFTLGLNEAWYDQARSIYLPVAPGCGWGQFDSTQHIFRVIDSAEAAANIREAEALIRQINPEIHMLYTVSPVPLVATFQNTSVLQATTLSKAVLRTAVYDFFNTETAHADRRHYFPSYEIITNPFEITKNFLADMRTISDAGERRVMGEFFSAVQSTAPAPETTLILTPATPLEAATITIPTLSDTKTPDPCDEEEYWRAASKHYRLDT